MFIAIGSILCGGGCLGIMSPWALDRPFWPALDEPPGKSELEMAMTDAHDVLITLLLLDALLYVVVTFLGVLIIAGVNVKWAGRVWVLCKLCTIAMRSILTWLVLEAQLDSIDPLQSSSNAVELPAIAGLAIVTVVRLALAAAIVGCTEWISHRQRVRLESA